MSKPDPYQAIDLLWMLESQLAGLAELKGKDERDRDYRLARDSFNITKQNIFRAITGTYPNEDQEKQLDNLFFEAEPLTQ